MPEAVARPVASQHDHHRADGGLQRPAGEPWDGSTVFGTENEAS